MKRIVLAAAALALMAVAADFKGACMLPLPFLILSYNTPDTAFIKACV